MRDRPDEIQADWERLARALRQIEALQRQVERHEQALHHLCALVARIALVCPMIDQMPCSAVECRGGGAEGEGQEGAGTCSRQEGDTGG